jgi:hypothetical protein
VPELSQLHGSRVNSAEGHVFCLECGGLGVDVGSDVTGFGSEEDVEDELDRVGLDTVSYEYKLSA